MPCNIGYKSYAKVVIPEPQPQVFKAKAEAPKIDAELLTKLGNEDPEFLEWIRDLDTRPLLEEALKRTLAKINLKSGVSIKVNAACVLEASGLYKNDNEKRSLDKAVSDVSERWQLEVIAIVTQLLGYTFTITQNGNELILEAEEEGKSHPCDYIKVTRKDGNSTLVFEHFKSRGALQLETAKFLTLADKLGVKIIVSETTISQGDPFPGEERHGHSHGHGHSHHHHDHDDHGHDHEE